MSESLKHSLFAVICGWGLLALVTCVLWSVTVGRWIRHAANERAKADKYLAMAEGYRDLQRKTGVDGEAYTYEWMAKKCEEKAAQHGHEVRPRALRSGASSRPQPLIPITPPSPAGFEIERDHED